MAYKTRPMTATGPRKPAEPLDFGNLPKALTIAETANVLRISVDGYYRYVRPAVLRKEILSQKIGRRWLILTSSLLSWQEQQARGTI
ncbi:MAG: helix-turn-helix domain-containing protein [Chloroflexales bacterium]